MTYKRFEELPVWQEAMRLAERIYELTEQNQKRMSFSLRDQLERAALSVSNNIAEGFERGTTSELLAFIYIARGSAGEVRSMLCFLERRAGFGDLKSQILDLKSVAESCSRQLRAWADSLQNPEIKGQRHLNNRTRSSAERKHQTEEFQRELLSRLPANHPLRNRPVEDDKPFGS
ncbi:MAG: four helix bundle protein [Verrucomicrobia bacterium]|nr:four helix bundle protein [Verrucomicrobiota bacterium]